MCRVDTMTTTEMKMDAADLEVVTIERVVSHNQLTKLHSTYQ